MGQIVVAIAEAQMRISMHISSASSKRERETQRLKEKQTCFVCDSDKSVFGQSPEQSVFLVI